MKRIKLLLPLWLILMYFGGIAFMLQSRKENIDEYHMFVEEARDYAKNGIVVDAISAYQGALALHPDINLALEAGEIYLNDETYQDAANWYTNTLYTGFPNERATYEYGIRLYLAQDNYREAFDVYNECKSRELADDEIERLMIPVLYSFDLSGEYEDVRPFGNLSGLAAVQYDGCWGYVDMSGDRVLEYVYALAGTFGDVGAVVDQDGSAYFIDRDGNKKITDKSILEQDPDLGKVECFLGIEGERLWAYNGAYWNCYDAGSYEKVCGGYTAVTNITNGVGAVRNEQAKWAMISSDGSLLTDFVYDDAAVDQKDIFCRASVVFVKTGDKYILLDREGKQAGDTTYEDVCAFYDTSYAAVKSNGKWSYIDAEGVACDVGTYDQAESFSNGLAAVCMDGKWGYIDQKGNLVIDCQFDAAGPFTSSGQAFVKPSGESSWKLLSLYKDN